MHRSVGYADLRPLHVDWALRWVEQPRGKGSGEVNLTTGLCYVHVLGWSVLLIHGCCAHRRRGHVGQRGRAENRHHMRVSMERRLQLTGSAGFLALFTAFMMLPTHIFLILKGRSTVESFQSSSQLKAEQSLLENEFQSKCLTADMRRVRRQWEAEYGGVAVNDRWAFGRKRDMWRREMGSSWVGWLCRFPAKTIAHLTVPIGRPLGDGVNFPANPRFGPNGEWLPMRDWPKVVAI